jgi:hypothetical protein
MPQPRVAVGLQLVGVRVAAITWATPVPLKATGELVTVKPPLVVIATVAPVDAPSAVGEYTILIVQVAPLFSVAPQVPPAAPVGRENGAVTAIVRLRALPVEFRTLNVWAALVVLIATLPNARDAGLTAIATPVPVRDTGEPVTVAPV